MIYAHIDTHQDFYSMVDVDYDTHYECEPNGCDSICRCGRISNARVKDLYPGSVEGWLGESIPKSATDLDRYILERLVRWVVKVDMFEVNYSPGYYGDEIDSVRIDTDTSAYQEFARKIEVFNRLTSTTQQVQMILTLEYGYLLPEIAAVEEWDVLDVAIKDVRVDDGVLERIKKEVAWRYVDHPLAHGIRGVVVRKDGAYRLVDGFHRFAAWTGQYEKRAYEPTSRKKKPKTRRKIRVLGPKESS
jgi:hypothetical protein